MSYLKKKSKPRLLHCWVFDTFGVHVESRSRSTTHSKIAGMNSCGCFASVQAGQSRSWSYVPHINRRPQPGEPTNCATVKCAAGLRPTPSDNRSQKEVEFGQCKIVCQVSLLVPVAMCNAAAGGGLAGTVIGAAAKGGLCTWVCK